ncbi:MAG: DNA translocase FtsK [Chloroflexi bacterium]|nr:DNA translocase FtsK [Chloroflexota bacterium]
MAATKGRRRAPRGANRGAVRGAAAMARGSRTVAGIVAAIALVLSLWFLPITSWLLAGLQGLFLALGLGVFLVLLGLAYVTWRRRRLPSSWQLRGRWLGVFILGVALLGMGGLVSPPGWSIFGASLEKASLGGELGRGIAGGYWLGGVLRLLALLVVGGALVTPRQGAGLGTKALAAYGSHRFRHPKSTDSSPGWEETPPVVPKAVTPEGHSTMAAPSETTAPNSGWELPPLSLLDKNQEGEPNQQDNEERARRIVEALASYGVEAQVVQINAGPTVTQFGVEPGWERRYRETRERDKDGRPMLDMDGRPKVRRVEVAKTRVKVEKIAALTNNLSLALAAPSVRIEAPVPGKSVVGIEVPNVTAGLVALRGVIESSAFQRLKARSRLALALGKGTAGEAVVADLARMPHLLIAGATGSGKSVCLNSIIVALLMHSIPEEVRLLLVDPKRVEMVAFNSVPHLLAPVVVELEKVVTALRWLSHEMDQRYREMAAVSARNIEAYNRNPQVDKPLPYIVMVIDELADLMMFAPYEVERTICRLAQLARATGIHLVIATQRPSVDVITGLIKANFPTRISFAVTSFVDSRTILDGGGAEKLLGRGDMLYMPTDAAKPKRLQGVYVSDAEIERVVNYWAGRRSQSPLVPQFEEAIELGSEETAPSDSLLAQAKELAAQHPRLSASFLQRRLRIGYPRAARLMETLEEEGALGGEMAQGREDGKRVREP